MENTIQEPLQRFLSKQNFPDPIKLTQPEPWQWEVLATGFLHDPTMNFWLGERASLDSFRDYFEAVVKDTFASGGDVFSTPDRDVVLVCTWLGANQQEPSEWKKRWYDVLGPEGVKRYNWLYDAGEVNLSPEQLQNSMLPDYLARLPDSKGAGSGSHLAGWAIDYYLKLGYDVPFIIASTPQAARLYCRDWGFYIHKNVFLENSSVPIGVFIKRKGAGL
ncbi:hypothetical protein [Larkinella arboricola]|nr:hypothetical protein [Larkinella arboricola]